MRPTDVIFNTLGAPDEEHAKECPTCSKVLDAVKRAKEEVARMQDASGFAQLTAENLSVSFHVDVSVNPNDMNDVTVAVYGTSKQGDPVVEVPDEIRSHTLERRSQDVTDSILKLWSALFTCNEANARIGKMYEEFEAIQEGEHAPASSHLN